MRTWLLILSPALLFTIAQALVQQGLLILGAGNNAGAIANCLLLPVVLACFCKLHRQEKQDLLNSRDVFLWLVVTALLALFNQLLPGGMQKITVPHLFASVLCAPICEELIYRGLTLNFARKHFGTPAAIAISSLLFAAAHGSILDFVAAALLGVVLCWMKLRFPSLLFPLLTHAVLNLTACLF